MNDEKKKLRSFVEKHTKTPEEIKAEIRTMEEAKKSYTQDVTALEQNLAKFNEVADPLIDPISGNPLCWVKRPTQQEWEDMVPDEELLKVERIEDIPPEMARKYKDHQFEMMAKLIIKPNHDAQWWKEHANLVFQELFQIHLTDVYRKLGVMVGNF